MTKTFAISNDFHHLSFDSTLGGRASSWKLFGQEILLSVENSPLNGGMYVMAPWVGRIDGACIAFEGTTYPQPINFPPWALHGVTPFSECQVVEWDASHIVFQQRIQDFLPTWPVDMVITHRWDLKDSDLNLSVSATLTEGNFVCDVGIHPFFLKTLGNGSTATMLFEPEHEYQVDDHFINHGISVNPTLGPWDTAFSLPARECHIEWKDFAVIRIKSSHQDFVIYDKHSDFFCPEPCTGPPNGINMQQFSNQVSVHEPLTLMTTWSASKCLTQS